MRCKLPRMQPFRAKLYWAVDYLQEVGQKCWWGRCRERSVRAEDRECLHFGNANVFTQTNSLFFVRISVISRKEQKNRQTEPADLPESIRQFQTVCFSTKHNIIIYHLGVWTLTSHFLGYSVPANCTEESGCWVEELWKVVVGRYWNVLILKHYPLST